MQPNDMLAQQAIQLLYTKERETSRLLGKALDLNRILLLQHQQQHQQLVQYLRTIAQLEAELRTCRSGQQVAFGLVHTN